MRKWSVRLFGALELESPSGQVIPFPGTKAGGILAYLALHPDKAISRVELADLFWPDSDPTRQRTRVRQELLALRSVFGDAEATIFRNDRHSIALSSERVITDVEQFLDRLEQSKLSVEIADRERLFTEAIALYRADLLTMYPEIGVGERAHLAQQFEYALRELATIQYMQREYKEAEASLHRLITYNPLLEEAHVDLIKVYAASCQPAKIRSQYNSLVHILRTEMDTGPTESTSDLVKELLQSIEMPANEQVHPLPLPSPEPIIALPEATADTLKPENEILQNSPMPVPLPRAKYRIMNPLGTWGLILIALALLWPLWRAMQPHHKSSLRPPALRINQEKWRFLYSLQAGESGDAEPKAVACDQNGAIYVTGLVQTGKDDADILSLKLSREGKLIAHARYSSPEHDCDRAFTLAYDGTSGIYVAGETFVPASHGSQEGWRLVLLHYDANLKLLWVRRSSLLTKNEPGRVRVVYSENGGVVVGGTAVENGVQKAMLLHYDTQGNVQWQRTFNAERGKPTVFRDMIVDGEGNLYVCTSALREITRYGSHTQWATLCYDRFGRQVWTRYCSGLGHGSDIPSGITFSEYEKAIYVAGTLYTGDPATGGTGTNSAIAKYKADGTPLWTRWDTATGPELNGFSSLARNSRPDVVTVATTANTPQRNSAIVLSQYDAAGNHRWTRQVIPPPGYVSTANPLTVTTDKDEVVVVGLLTSLPTSRLYENSKFLLAHYSIEGALKDQTAFSLLDGVNRPTVASSSSTDNSVLIGGQSQMEKNHLTLTMLKY